MFNSGLRINAEMYQTEILPVYLRCLKDTSLFPNQRKVLFQQDMAPAHSAKSTLKVIEEAGVMTWGKNIWPGNSPDFNVIEHIWKDLQDSVFVKLRPRNILELKARVVEKWDSITVDHLRKLVESFPARIEECKLNNGNVTKY